MVEEDFMRILLGIIGLVLLITIGVSSAGIKNITMSSRDVGNDCMSCHSNTINSSESHFIETSDDCQFCHITNDNSSDHEVLSIKNNDICVACHVGQSDMNTADVHSSLYCVECHSPHGSKQDYMFRENVVTMCRESCHTNNELGNSHSVGGHVIDTRTGQQLTCISTCHSLHNPKEEKLLQYSETYVCYECHQEMY